MSMTSLSSLSSEENNESSDEEKRRKRRRFEDRLNAFEKFDNADFKSKFRLNKETVLYLAELIGNNIQPTTKRNMPVEAVDQILITLCYFATGSYQQALGDIFHVTQPTVHRIIHRVAAEIAKLKPLYISMPDPQERMLVAKKFCAIASFPRVIGAIDCTHVRINSPRVQDAQQYRNKKGFFSLNIQIVGDASLKIRNIIAKWPGSVHDTTIFNDSPLCAQFENGDFGSMHLLGDGDYMCHNFLLTPLSNPSTPAEETYNHALMSTRSPIERLFAVLKGRFPCLHNGLGVKLENVPTMITACAVLHNIALARNDDIEFADFIIEDKVPLFKIPDAERMKANFSVRDSVIKTYFTQ